MINFNFCKKVSRKYFYVANGLAFLTAITMCSCEDNISNDITGDIENIEESVSYENDEYGITRKESFADIEARADAQFQKAMNLRKNRVRAASGIPHYVGVLSGSGGCPSGVPNISYHQDCEDNGNDTKYIRVHCNNCYTPKGAKIDKYGNVNWSVCIVDARKYNFKRTKYAYAIFDLSMEQYYGSDVPNIYVYNDDEDDTNGNQYYNASFGFKRSDSGYPVQERNQQYKENTEFWLLYFTEDSKSNYKLPNLGFDYDVFSNFGCDFSKQAILQIDSEDDNCRNHIDIFYPNNNNTPAHTTYNKQGWVDNKYSIVKNDDGHMFYAIQKSSVYRN